MLQQQTLLFKVNFLNFPKPLKKTYKFEKDKIALYEISIYGQI